MKVAIVKYNAGNTCSVINALKRLGVEPRVTDDAEILRSADRVIFPGVGEASTAMKYLREHGLDLVIPTLKQPVLAICLGMQLLGESSEENDAKCLGIMPFRSVRFVGDVRVPHIGWNEVSNLSSPLFDGIDERSRVYFVHSYKVPTGESAVATTDYGGEFSAAINYRNFYGVQFHPEKSGAAGSRLIANFLEIEV